MLYIGDGTHSYYIQRPSTSTDPIYVAMMPVANQYFTFHAANANGSNKYEYEVSNKTMEANNWYELEISTTKLQTGATFGKFSIGVSNTVHFSQGNLQRISGSWQFASHQYDVLGSWSSNSCDLFFWEATGNYGSRNSCITSTGTSSDVVNWGVNISGTWNTPSTTEWQYIFNSRGANSFARGKVGTQTGVFLFPDHYTHPTDLSAITGMNESDDFDWSTGNNFTALQWAKMEAAGAVFLPAAGYRNGTDVYDVGLIGIYWSSTADDDNFAWDVSFDEYFVSPDYNNFRNYGQSVRLVCE